MLITGILYLAIWGLDPMVISPHRCHHLSMKNQMDYVKTTVGLWIDHRKAVIVNISPDGVKTTEILSDVEKQPGRLSGVRSTTPFETLLVPADDSHEREFTGHLNQYYSEVIEAIRHAESIQIFGPGEAKGELKKRLELAKYDGLILAMESADKMTDRQIAAKVRERSHKWTPTPLPVRHYE